MKLFIKILTVLYVPIFLVGVFLIGLSQITMTLGSLLILELDDAKKGFNKLINSSLKRR